MTKVLILSADGFEQSELMKPKAALEDAGYETVVASIESGEIKGWDENDWGKSVSVDLTLGDVDVNDYAALLLPGGQINPDLLRVEKDAIAIVKKFNDAGKPIAAICHAPWLLIEAGIVNGKTATCYTSIRTDLKNAGANVVDQEVAEDGNLITSRNPDDLPAFSKTLIGQIKAAAA
ncbi:MAG: type 1 glutamine amidotransferase domain-containing protein [Pontixanthobacter sp.]